MREQPKPSSSRDLPSATPAPATPASATPGNQPGYTCAICGAKVPDLAPTAQDAAAAKAVAMHRYRPFCSARCQRIDLGNWLDERYVVPGPPVPTEGGEGDDSSEKPEPGRP